jgi:hypothetical protein
MAVLIPYIHLLSVGNLLYLYLLCLYCRNHHLCCCYCTVEDIPIPFLLEVLVLLLPYIGSIVITKDCSGPSLYDNINSK